MCFFKIHPLTHYMCIFSLSLSLSHTPLDQEKWKPENYPKSLHTIYTLFLTQSLGKQKGFVIRLEVQHSWNISEQGQGSIKSSWTISWGSNTEGKRKPAKEASTRLFRDLEVKSQY